MSKSSTLKRKATPGSDGSEGIEDEEVRLRSQRGADQDDAVVAVPALVAKRQRKDDQQEGADNNAAPSIAPSVSLESKLSARPPPQDAMHPGIDIAATSTNNAAAVVGPALASLPELLQLDILSYCNVPSLNAMMRTSPMFIKMARSDMVWEGNLKLLLETTFDGAFGDWRKEYKSNPPTPISQRPDWKCSTAFRKWYDECNAKGQRVSEDINRQPGMQKLSDSQKGLAVRATFQKYDEELPKPTITDGKRVWTAKTWTDTHLPEHHKWVWKDVRLMHYYRSAATFAAAGVHYRMKRAVTGQYCPCCYVDWSRHFKSPGCSDDRGVLANVFGTLPIISIFNVNAIDNYNFGVGDDLAVQFYRQSQGVRRLGLLSSLWRM